MKGDPDNSPRLARLPAGGATDALPLPPLKPERREGDPLTSQRSPPPPDSGHQVFTGAEREAGRGDFGEEGAAPAGSRAEQCGARACAAGACPGADVPGGAAAGNREELPDAPDRARRG